MIISVTKVLAPLYQESEPISWIYNTIHPKVSQSTLQTAVTSSTLELEYGSF